MTDDTLARARAAIEVLAAVAAEATARPWIADLDAAGEPKTVYVPIEMGQCESLLALARAVVLRMEAEAARAAIADEPLDYEGDELDAQNERLFAVLGAEAAVEEDWRTTVPAALARLAGDEPGEVVA